MKDETACGSGSIPGALEQAAVTPAPDEAWGNNTYEVQVFRRDDGSVSRLSIRWPRAEEKESKANFDETLRFLNAE